MEQATNSSELPSMLTDLMFGTWQTIFQWSIPFMCPVVLEISLVRLVCHLSPSHLLLFLSTSMSPFSLSVSLPCYRLPSSPSLSLVYHSSGAAEVLSCHHLSPSKVVLMSVPNPVPVSSPLTQTVCPQSSTLPISGPLPVSGATWCRLV